MKQPYNTTIYNTALYMRLSRDDENYGDSVSIETQKQMLEDFARRNGLPNPTHFTDAAVIIGLKTLRLKKCQKHAAF